VAFDDAKLEMLHFHQARQDTITEEIKIWLPHGTVVELGTRGGKKDVVRWIGIFFDRKLSFNHYICIKLASTRRTFAAISRLIRHETGLSPLATCQLYQVCIIPRSNYGAEIWWNKQQNLE
jgi:threonine dehydrogenase-like Zn-dependent dehydrogenase